jgi:uncharacterized RDD family membrane protein YckC
MDFRVDTPEAVSISYTIAGIGSRFLAALLDAVIEVSLLIVILLGAAGIGSLPGFASTIATVLLITLIFLLLWGYYLLFEAFWGGQTPGKRAVRIRVIKTSGYPIGFLDSATRNVVRIVDFLPSFYAVGVITMFVSHESRRLGDLAAGTVVVKVPKQAGSAAAFPQPAALSQAAAPRAAFDPDEALWNLRALSATDLSLVENFLERVGKLPLDARQRVGAQIASGVAERIGAREPADSAVFLRRVAELQRQEEALPPNPYTAP